MSEPIKTLAPVQAQTPSRGTADEQERGVERQRTWVLRKGKGQREERRDGDRRQVERREKERRSSERRSDDRRQGSRFSDDRRALDRRKSDRRDGDRRGGDRRVVGPQAPGVSPREQETPESGPQRRRGIIDDYA